MRLALDPDFGDVYPSTIVAFNLKVYPVCDSSGKVDPYDIIVLVPSLDDSQVELEITHKIAQLFLENGDNYEITKFLEEDLYDFDASMPVIGYDAGLFDTKLDDPVISCFWLVPPMWERH